jgi:CheY-like chemotaxis protein
MAQYTILLVDYEPRSVEQLREPLEQAGYQVAVANDGVAGAALFLSLKPDLLLIEAMLPKKHGFELCKELKRTPRGKQTPIVIITGVYKGRKYRTQALHEYGCDAYIEKPITAEKLVETIGQLLPKRVSARPPAPAPPPKAVPVAEGATFEDEITDRLDSILAGDRGVEREVVRGAKVPSSGTKGPRASAVGGEILRFGQPGAARRSAAACGPASRGGAQPALLPFPDPGPSVQGLAVPDDEPDPQELRRGIVLVRDTVVDRAPAYPWIAVTALVAFVATILVLLV